MSIEIWEGSAEVTGYGALAAHDGTYPVETGSVNDETGERVDLKISEPTQIAGPLASSMYKQTVKLRVTADPSRVQDLAMEMLLVTADALAFATDRNVQTSLSHLTKVTSQDDQSEGDTKLFMRRFKGPQELAVLDTGFLAYIWGQLDDVETDRSRRIIRALRWLRRASLTDDEVEEFATLAMAYEAMTSLLPKPSTRGEVKKQSKGEGSPTSVEILTHWAVDRCGIPEEHWRQVGRMRNGLFHGGLTENTEVRSGLAAAIPYIRLALGLALKHALNLSSDNPGRDTLLGNVGVDVIYGGEGDDTLRGGNGADRIAGGGGHDLHDGGLHDDRLDARDGVAGNDILVGSKGEDTRLADAGDRIGRSCEE